MSLYKYFCEIDINIVALAEKSFEFYGEVGTRVKIFHAVINELLSV
jgi:hypothetical protein